MTALPPGADRAHLARAYADGSKFEARRNLYAYLRPPRDFLGWALDHLELHARARVLDVGCGPGYYLSRLRARATDAPIVGVDLSEGMVRAASAATGERAVAVASVQSLPFATDGFDAVLAMHMLYHAPDIPGAVAELRRVLRPGGVLLTSTLSGEHLAELRSLMGAPSGAARLPRTSDRFNLENGRDQLAGSFTDIAVDSVQGTIVLDDPEPAVAFVASARDLHADQLPNGRTWDDVVAHARAVLAAEIERTGTVRLRAHTGVFVCR